MMKHGIAAVGLALATGCASMMGSQQAEKKSETLTAQDRAANQFQAAADAQKKANEAQVAAEKADREVDAAQKALAEARARSRGLHLKAEQSQADARQMADRANERGAEAQQQAGKMQSRDAQAHEQKVNQNSQAWNSQQTLSGQVLEAKGSALKVRTAGRKDVSLDLNDATAISIDGRQGTAAQVLPGSDVRASYQLVDGRAQALKLEVRSNEGPSSQDKASQPAAPQDSRGPAMAPQDSQQAPRDPAPAQQDPVK